MSEEKRVPCEVWSRIVGYLRPKQNWAAHKQHEFDERETYKLYGGESINRTEGASARGENTGMGTGSGLTQPTADDWARNDPAAWEQVDGR